MLNKIIAIKELPTKLAQIIAVISLPTAYGAINLVDFILPLLPKLNEQSIVLLKTSIFLGVISVCLLVIIISLVYHLRTRDIKVTIGKFTGE